jgi:hypothetical protein
MMSDTCLLLVCTNETDLTVLKRLSLNIHHHLRSYNSVQDEFCLIYLCCVRKAKFYSNNVAVQTCAKLNLCQFVSHFSMVCT